MSFKLSELLNPAPKSRPPSPPSHGDTQASVQQAQQHNEMSYNANAWPGYAPDSYSAAATTVYEAADALTALATSGGHSRHSSFAQHFSVYSSAYEQYGSARSYSDERPTSSYSVTGAPVVSSPSITQKPFSPTQDLDQYHHTPKSFVEQRRHSIFTRESPPPRLAPIQSLTSSLNEGIHQPSSWRQGAQLVDSGVVRSHDDLSYRAIHSEKSDRQAGYPQAYHDHDEPTSTQFRQPVPGTGSQTLYTQIAGPLPVPQFAISSAPIKSEPTATPREGTPAARKSSIEDYYPGASLEEIETMKAIAALQNEHGTRTASKNMGARRTSITPAVEPLKANARKRPAPKASTKRGMAAAVKKPAAKKRKVETSGLTGTTLQRSVTPSSQTSKTPVIRGGASLTGTPAASSPVPPSPAPTHDVSASEADDSGDVFCICRKPDNHTWMIACDGTCDDWYHGNCININESDGALIDKYICPICQEKGIGNTTWKPMCRNGGCRKPARLKKGDFSKYCSPECGREFFAKRMGLSPSVKRKRGSKATVDAALVDVDEEDLGPLGGPIRTRDLKALMDAAATVEEFKRLGDPATVLLTPPSSAKILPSALPGLTSLSQPSIAYTSEEGAQLARIAAQKTNLRRKRALLKDKDRFLSMTKQRSAKIVMEFLGLEGEEALAKPANKKAINEICGYDSRLSWDLEEFRRWREETEAGRRAFLNGYLEAPQHYQVNGVAEHGHASSSEDAPLESSIQGNGASATANTKDAGAGENDTLHVCLKKRCERHKQWQKLALQDVRFEEADVGDEMRRVEREEKEVVEGAVLRERTKDGKEGGRVERLDGNNEDMDRHAVENDYGVNGGGDERGEGERLEIDGVMSLVAGHEAVSHNVVIADGIAAAG